MATTIPATEDDLHALLANVLASDIRSALQRAGVGQCMRITTLPAPVMSALCKQLHGGGRYRVVLVVADAPTEPWEATATKVIEHRNEESPPPLLVFIPDVRTAAEDSLDIATFTELALPEAEGNLREALLDQLPADLAQAVERTLEYVRVESIRQNGDEEIEYLLTVVKNGATAAAAGAALYCFGLVPDLDGLTVTKIEPRLSRNWNAVKKLDDASAPLLTRISRMGLAPNSLQKKLFSFLRGQEQRSRRWGRALVVGGNDALTFDKWEFADAGDAGQLRLILEDLGLPRQIADEVGGTVQMPVLDLSDGRAALKVAFRSLPKPAEVPSWKHFRIQILSSGEDESTVAWESNNYPTPTGRRPPIRRTVKAKDLLSLEEGIYFVRINAYDAHGNLLNSVADQLDGTASDENESDFFLVVKDGAEVEESDSRAIFARSFHDAWASLGIRALGNKSPTQVVPRASLTGAWAEPLRAPLRGDVQFGLAGVDAAGHTIVVPGVFRRIQHELLSNPRQVGPYLLDLRVAKLADLVVKWESPGRIPDEFQPLLEAREKFFIALREQHGRRAPDDVEQRFSIVETADLLELEPEAVAYIAAYNELAEQQKTSAWKLLAQLDTVVLRWHRSPGDPGRALLVAPTHPARIAWHLQHARFLNTLIDEWQGGLSQSDDFRRLINQVREDFFPSHVPSVCFDSGGRGFVESGNLSSHWSIYLPEPDAPGADDVVDLTAIRDKARKLLGLRGYSAAQPAVGSAELGARFFEYLSLHPYVEQLRINVFNPGDGAMVADALREVERHRKRLGKRGSAPQLRYVVRLIAPKQTVDSTGDALESLLDPDRQVGEDDEFTLASNNHLHPKLVFARNSVDEFQRTPDDFGAHISVMFEQFSLRARVDSVAGLRRGSFAVGLIQEPEVRASRVGRDFTWEKGLKAVGSAEGDEWEQRLTASIAAAQQVQAVAVVGASPRPEPAPLLAMCLDDRGQSLLKQVHEASDWVLTLDRNLGLEFYDSPSAADDAGYLLDFAPEYLQLDRLRLMLTTRSPLELRSIISPTLAAYGLDLPAGGERAALEGLRSLSGRLALRIMSSPTHAAEVVGLLLARWTLAQVGALAQRIVIPVDAHRGWFDAAGEFDVRKRRADLLLLSFDPKTRTIFCQIVEVKLREELPNATRGELYKKMREQIESTKERLRERFDWHRFPGPRADRLLRAKELTTLLAFYIRRAERYRLVDAATAATWLDFVQGLDGREGYNLEFSELGVVFERAATGAHVDEDEPGLRVHRFGHDVARELVQQACEDSARPSVADVGDPTKTTVPGLDSLRDAIERTGVALPPRVPAAKRPLPTASTSELRSAQAVAPSPRPEAQEEVRAPAEKPQPTAENQQAAPPSAELSRDVDEPGSIAGAALEPQRPANLPPVRKVDLAAPDVLVGATEMTKQYGVIGRFGKARVAIDLNGCNTVSLFGVQGFGKSYTLGVISEMATLQVPGINLLPAPLATVIFHYHKSDAYAPEYASAVRANVKEREVAALAEYGASPAGLPDVVLLAPEAKVDERKREFPGMDVRAIKFGSSELGADSWKFLLGAYGNDSMYVRQMVQIMRTHRSALTLDAFRHGIQNAGMTPSAVGLAETRIRFAEPYIDDQSKLRDLLRPGRTVIVDLRDEWIEKDEALGLFVVMLRIFAASKHEGRDFNKLVVFDEAHKYITESDLIGQVVETIREMRHQATSVVIASQDPLSVPRAVIELTSILLLHRMTSPQWLKHLKGAISALDGIEDGHVAALKPGEALLWAQRSTDPRFTQKPQRIQIRPRFTMHGGGTKTAVSGETVR